MKNRRLAPFALGCLLALLPSFLSAGPWDPNRARPPGFQRTLAYLEADLYNYPLGELQSVRNHILQDDLVTTLIAALKNGGYSPDKWEAVGQQTYDGYLSQYEALKKIIRQTMSDPEGLIRAVEGNQPLAGDLLEHPNAKALIMVKWQLLNVAEQTYQALLYAGIKPGPGRPPTGIPDVNPPKPGKSKDRIDWERMRETRRKAIERRRAFEERWAAEARRRLAEINEIIRYLRNNGSLSENKFKASRPGAGSGGFVGSAEPAPAPTPAASASTESSAPSVEEIEKIEEDIEQLAKKIEAAEGAKVEPTKVKVYRGTLVFHRPPGLDDPAWQKLKGDIIAANAKAPTLSDMEDKGDEVRWRYKTLTPPQSEGLFEVIPDGEPTEEAAEGEPTPKKKEPASTGNGDADPVDEKVIPGTEEKPAKPATKSTPAKPAPKPAPEPEPVETAKATPGYWYDPTDMSRKSKDKFIYVRVDGEAVRVPLREAKNYGVPANATLDNMTWYSESTGEIVEGKDRGTHRGSDQPKSTNKFAKPKD